MSIRLAVPKCPNCPALRSTKRTLAAHFPLNAVASDRLVWGRNTLIYRLFLKAGKGT